MWKPVKNYEGIYEINENGNVRSLTRTIKTAHGATRSCKGQTIKTAPNITGYLTWRANKQGCGKTLFVHVEVANAFLPNPLNLADVHHIDYNKANCNITNLRWVSHEDNMRDASVTGHVCGKTRFEKRNNKYKHKQHKCIDCKKLLLDNESIRCRSCAAIKEHGAKYRMLFGKIPAHILHKALIKCDGNFTKVGRYFKTSRSTIYKLCIKYNLPRLSSDYK